MHGFEMGEFLTKRGRKITIVDEVQFTGRSMVILHGRCLLTVHQERR